MTVSLAPDDVVQTHAEGAANRRGGLSLVAWSADGKRLYAAGTYGEASGRKLLRAWRPSTAAPGDASLWAEDDPCAAPQPTPLALQAGWTTARGKSE